jgi:xylan 1,4-beta-xylosidase
MWLEEWTMTLSALRPPTVTQSDLVEIDRSVTLGPAELWRHTLGVGGINTTPLPAAVVSGTRALRPRLIRIFIQQFFNVYPAAGRFDWSRLDPYMDALSGTGAKIVAALCIKPGPLYDQIDESVWRPNDVAAWQSVVKAMVQRYSVERDLVSYWEIGNETDIGEHGGSPFLIPDPADYVELYEMTAPVIRDTAPHVKVGGTAACWVTNEPLPGFVKHCRANGVPLDFISWHIYNDDWERHAWGVREGKRLVEGFPGGPLELLVTEWNKSFDTISVADQAMDPRRAALVAADILAMADAELDWSFYYHLWDQVCDADEFKPFFSPTGVQAMLRHWNEVPHRFGLFGERGEVRPQYFVYQLLGMLDDTRIQHRSECSDLHVLATTGESAASALLVNTTLDAAAGVDRVVTVKYSGLEPGPHLLTVYRIDDARRWSPETLQQHPLEERVVVTGDVFEHQVFMPAHTVAMATLTDREGIR